MKACCSPQWNELWERGVATTGLCCGYWPESSSFKMLGPQYDPLEIERLVAPIEAGEADVVYGSRFQEGWSQANGPIHWAANRLLTTLSNWMTGLRLSDMETCQKAFRRDVVKGMQLHENGLDRT